MSTCNTISLIPPEHSSFPVQSKLWKTLHNCYTTHASHNSPSHSTGTPTTILHSQTRAALGHATVFNTPRAHRSTRAYGWNTSTASPLISYAKDSNKPAKNTVPLQLPPMSNANGCTKDGSWSGIAGDYCVLETLKNIRNVRPDVEVFTAGVASIDGGTALDAYLSTNCIPVFTR